MAPEKDKLSRKDKADLLFRKYALLKSEVHLQIKYFKNHVKNFQLVASPLIAGASYLLTDPRFAPADTNKFIWLVALFVIVTATTYLIYDVADASYQILVLAERIGMLEQQINRLAGQKLLIWESEISETLNAHFRPFRNEAIFHPLWCMRGYAAILLAFLLIGLPSWGAIRLWMVTSTQIWLTYTLTISFGVYAFGSAIFALIVAAGIENRLRPAARAIMAT